MKRQLLGVAAILLSISTYAQDNPLWMRYCAISPDGTTIAFTYKGDIYTVPSTGGRASQITTNPAHDTKIITMLSSGISSCKLSQTTYTNYERGTRKKGSLKIKLP